MEGISGIRIIKLKRIHRSVFKIKYKKIGNFQFLFFVVKLLWLEWNFVKFYADKKSFHVMNLHNGKDRRWAHDGAEVKPQKDVKIVYCFCNFPFQPNLFCFLLPKKVAQFLIVCKTWRLELCKLNMTSSIEPISRIAPLLKSRQEKRFTELLTQK